MNFSWPLFDGLRAKGAIDLAQAQLEVAEIALAQEREAVALEVARTRRAQSVPLGIRGAAADGDRSRRNLPSRVAAVFARDRHPAGSL